jgi:hypothetical protein
MRKGINLEHVLNARKKLVEQKIRPTYNAIHAEIKLNTGISASQRTLAKYIKFLNQTDPAALIEDANILGQLEQILRKLPTEDTDMKSQLIQLDARMARIENALISLGADAKKLLISRDI